MKKHLYEIFASKWVTKGTIFLYSDPHFGDLDSYKFRHVFKTKIEGDKVYYETGLGVWEDEDSLRCSMHFFDEMQIKNINSKVGKKDTIIFLGDIGDIEYIKKIRGYKVLIMGNHDKGASNYKRYVDFYDGEGDNHLFDEVYEGPLMISEKIILSHEPIDNLPNFLYNIHGHDHGCTDRGEQYFNVCAEGINYFPVPLIQLIKSGKLSKIPSIHRITIDEATERKKKRLEKNK